ncbi:hypothetical protein [Fluviispira multicolorata]|uniref:Uncharacterized protein n=1 Tax=Fluviispira multicolorata TaxID=2654512 RepID=A0A833JCZ7_9BACT|nr:hypothetical protein [Fluviispira multicolorata]KAB8027962.1 hypothetical protein GCL57_12980 [Fluviispira multicolorata]
METVVLIFRTLFLVIGSLTGLVYFLLQLYQKMPNEKFKLLTADYIVYSFVALVFGFGTNSYYGLLAFLPLIVMKFISKKFIAPNKLRGSGFWLEIDWKKLTPKGFDRNVPRHILEEMNKMLNSTPKDTHFIIPRIYAKIAIYFMMRKMKKETQKMPTGFTNQQKNMGMEQFTSLAQNILKLEPGNTEKKDLNIGILKVTRL